MIYLLYLLAGLAPFLIFFGIVIPALASGMAYAIAVPILDVFHKQFSKETTRTFIIFVFCLTLIISCGSFLYFTFHNGIPLLD
jgi:uncharacterized PurR-regulated membrane protein YhhQ (DUF165 family)